jgi:hypothetical protein
MEYESPGTEVGPVALDADEPVTAESDTRPLGFVSFWMDCDEVAEV